MGYTHYALRASGEGPVERCAGPSKVVIALRCAEEWERCFDAWDKPENAAANDVTSQAMGQRGF